jgi:hypothetical protein
MFPMSGLLIWKEGKLLALSNVLGKAVVNSHDLGRGACFC